MIQICEMKRQGPHFLFFLWFFISQGAWSVSVIPYSLFLVFNFTFSLAISILFLRNSNKQFVVCFKRIYFLFLICVLFDIVRGIFLLPGLTYWHIKAFFTNMFVIATWLTIYLASNSGFIINTMRLWLKCLPFFCFFLLLFEEPRLWANALIPITFLLFIVKNKRIYLLLVVLSIILCCVDLESRSPIVKYGMALLISFPLFLSIKVPLFFLRIVNSLFYFLPVIFFVLAITGNFNILSPSDYVSEPISVHSTTSDTDVNFMADTRTFIYEEVILSAINNEYVMTGRTFARGNDSYYAQDLYEGINLKERFANESSILNVFTWMGLVGLLLYSLLFVFASFYSINHAKSIRLKFIGLYLSFIWAFSWIEIYSILEMQYVVYMMMLGMCVSKQYLKMNDDQLVSFGKQIMPFFRFVK